MAPRIIAHNFGGYDGQFILRHIIDKGVAKPTDLATNGNKIITMTVYRIRFIDSLNFLAMKLAKFLATFGLKEIKKGYFPHIANTEEFWNYSGPNLDAKYYSPESMSVKDRETFMLLYNEKVCLKPSFASNKNGRFRNIFKSHGGHTEMGWGWVGALP